MKRLVLVEDHVSIREMLAEVLRSDGRYTVVGEAGEGLAGLELCLELRPDVLVLDVRLPGLNGVELVRRLGRHPPLPRILAFSADENPDLLRELLAVGVRGFVEKTAGLGEFRRGLDAVADGGVHFGPAAARLLRTVLAHPKAGSGADLLTPREREILQLVAEANSTKEIAAKLGLSAKTVDNHRTHLMQKLNLHDVASLTRYALTNRLS
jgi:DNA-binding NarL/FixJ family response regulator